jgi:DeoR/GlpR family transcriptional regulator of sugar metabolism
MISTKLKIAIKAASILFTPQDSSFLDTGNSMNEINKAIPMGINIVLANTKTAKTAKTVESAKNIF